MGCAETKNSAEETAMIEAEKGLNFYSLDANDVDTTIRKYSTNGKVNEAQLFKIAEKLGIQVTNKPPYSKIENMFKKLCFQGPYELSDLLVIGILLSQGQCSMKSRLLYEVFDETLSNSIHISTMTDLVLAKLADHSSKTLPILLTSEILPNSNMIKNEKYINDMALAKNLVIKTLGARLAVNGEMVTLHTFVEVFRTFYQGSLTSSSGWRKFLIDTFVANPQKKTFMNPYKNNKK